MKQEGGASDTSDGLFSITNCTYSISPTGWSFSASGGNGSVAVSTQSTCIWTAASSATWIIIPSGISGIGNGSVNYTVAANSGASPRTGTMTIAGQVFTITQTGLTSGSKVSLFVPIVLSAAGLNNSFFTSELTLTNRGSSSAAVTFNYTAAFGGGSGTAAISLPAGQQLIKPDAISYLKSTGIPIPDSGNRGGTLLVTISNLSSPSEAAVTVRTTTAVSNGRAGLAYAGMAGSAALTGSSYLCGLRQNATDRSNVAFQNVGSVGAGDITLQVTVFSGDGSVSKSLPDITQAPGGFSQISGVLSSNGLSLSDGYVRIARKSGTASYFAYGVVNDQANSDGSFVAPQVETSNPVSGLTLPVIVEASPFPSELVVTNWSTDAKTLQSEYVTEAVGTPDKTARFRQTLRAAQQVIIPNLVQYLRDQQVAGIGSAERVYAGALFVTAEGGDNRGVFVGARTSAPGGGGRYGLFYAAVPYGMASTSTAWLYGLQQDGENRTNLALVNTGETDGTSDTFKIELFNGTTGQVAGTIEGISVNARRWLQLGAILTQYAPEVTQGYARVTRVSGSNPFIPYAVINDGSRPNERTGDGAFLLGSP